MKGTIFLPIVACAVLFMTAGTSYGGDTVNIPVSLEVKPVTDISINRDPLPLVIDTAVPGEAPTPVTDSSTSYSISTNGTLKKITVVLDQATPPETILRIRLAAPAGASSLGDITLTTTPTDAVSGLGKKKGTNLMITYTLSVQTTGMFTPTTTRRVTFTVVDG